MGKLVALDRGWGERGMVIWRVGRLQAFTWRGEVRPVRAVLARWTDGAGRRWLRVQDAGGGLFLLGEDDAGWTVTAWPPRPMGLPGSPSCGTIS